MEATRTYQKVPVPLDARSVCLGPDGAVAHVTRTLHMISGRWKMPILFRLYADSTMRSSQLLSEIEGISQKMLTQHLRELEQEGLIDRRDFGKQPPRVEYRLTTMGFALMPVLLAARQFSEDHPDGLSSGDDFGVHRAEK
ncbi:helix-turn-helix transcriptional regulator [Neorhizobium sp. BETTINA12A]|uniref:winged helix-turn-helix transcriptional regulator n=1 Tax=Neorhizobium sp. BETTINA12A TaxID=2908924 RepID=UPI001FF18B7C|nr:helix-turn-helix domain-containing protein [Neorhizobium sp. BETTINA12A]MCJ9749589.1 helix-turn-helix transcriptional regulator [Neorhizobium sp. BETTINA12A]